MIFTSLLFFISVVLSPLCSLSCHPHRFFLLCQSGGFAALLLPYLGGVASKVIFISLLNLFSLILMHYPGIGLFGMVSLHYTGIGLFGMVSLGIFGYTLLLFFGGRAVACGSNFNGQCSIPPLDKGLSYSQLQFWSKK